MPEHGGDDGVGVPGGDDGPLRAGRAAGAGSDAGGEGGSFVLNGQRRGWLPGLTLSEVVEAGRIEPRSLATSVNACFVQRGQRGQTSIAPDDVVLFFQPIVGG